VTVSSCLHKLRATIRQTSVHVYPPWHKLAASAPILPPSAAFYPAYRCHKTIDVCICTVMHTGRSFKSGQVPKNKNIKLSYCPSEISVSVLFSFAENCGFRFGFGSETVTTLSTCFVFSVVSCTPLSSTAWCRPSAVLQCFDTVGWVIWPVKIVPNMTYNVFGGTLNSTTTTTHVCCPLPTPSPLSSSTSPVQTIHTL